MDRFDLPSFLMGKAAGGGGSGGGLPEVSASDNGDVLTVVEGAWAKAAPSGGGGVLVVNVDEQTGTLDKTWQEIDDADYCVIKLSNASGSVIWVCFLTTASNGNYSADFYTARPLDSYFVLQMIRVSTDSPDGYPAVQGGG